MSRGLGVTRSCRERERPGAQVPAPFDLDTSAFSGDAKNAEDGADGAGGESGQPEA
ncbi:hypothetical protein [Streptomyces sp. bgisy159]|uniref:hypothetical protein n=1 Tax=Streptomyces sp. bgisy159 TaxID=3413795 RepID=UPI003F49F4BC